MQHGSESIDRKLKKFHGLPLLTHEMWSEVIEKSHAPSHPLLGGKEWAGEVTKVALVREYSLSRYFDDYFRSPVGTHYIGLFLYVGCVCKG